MLARRIKAMAVRLTGTSASNVSSEFDRAPSPGARRVVWRDNPVQRPAFGDQPSRATYILLLSFKSHHVIGLRHARQDLLKPGAPGVQGVAFLSIISMTIVSGGDASFEVV